MVLPAGATLTQAINAELTDVTDRTNATQTLALVATHVDQTLEPHAGNYIEFETHLNATSQVPP